MGEFVSGIAGRASSAPIVEPAGAALLHRIRAHALTQAAALARAAAGGFDGAETVPADAAAAELRETYDAIARLADAVLQDPDLAAPLAARLARGGR
jgi:hypothetical protein